MRWPHVLITRYRSYPSDGWSDPISGRNVAQGGAVMNQLETGEAPEAVRCRSDLQKELAEVLRQRAAISAVLRAFASSPDDLHDHGWRGMWDFGKAFAPSAAK
jgi:hypothetical protein